MESLIKKQNFLKEEEVVIVLVGPTFIQEKKKYSKLYEKLFLKFSASFF